MTSLPGSVLLPQALRLGPLRMTSYGACAAAGIVAAMALSGRVAQRFGLDRERAWDAGLFAVVSCFAASRLLLVLRDPHAFWQFPVLVLSLPSLTVAGLLLAAVMTWIWIRWKRLPLLRLLDTFAPGGALLAAFLELGHWIDGSEPGMPLNWRWMGLDLAAPGLRLHPVALYGAVGALLLCGALLLSGRRLTRPGRLAAAGLMAGGLLAFLLALLTLPTGLGERWSIEPGQVLSLAALLAGALLWSFAPVSLLEDSETAARRRYANQSASFPSVLQTTRPADALATYAAERQASPNRKTPVP